MLNYKQLLKYRGDDRGYCFLLVLRRTIKERLFMLKCGLSRGLLGVCRGSGICVVCLSVFYRFQDYVKVYFFIYIGVKFVGRRFCSVGRKF